MSNYWNMTIPQAFDNLASKQPDRPAIIYLGTVFSYGRIKELADLFAAGLQSRGMEPGSRIIIYMPNSVQWAVAWLGIMKAGCIAVPITPIYTPYDLEYIANDTQASAVVCADRNFGYVTRVLNSTGLKTVIYSGLVDLLPAFKRLFGWVFDKIPTGKVARNPQSISIRKLLGSGASSKADSGREPDSPAEILYTGGTTKHPKGVPISHQLLLQCAGEQLATSNPLFPPQENVILGSAPMFHVLGQTCGLGTLCTYGGCLVLQPRVNLDAMLDSAQRYQARTLIGVPALYRMILDHDRLDLYDLSSIDYAFCGGDVLPLEIGRRWERRFGKPIYTGYGATETIGGVSMTPPGQKMPPGCMGAVLPSKDILVVEASSLEEAKTGQPGELLVHSQPMVSAYLNKPEETAKSFVSLKGKLYYRTGDMVARDEQQYLYFVDRTMDTIKHKGYRVSATEIESTLQEHPAVIESCVVGIPDEKVGERIKAFVVLKKDIKGITGYDLIQWCRQKLVSYKIPQYIEFRDMLPKSKVGKLLRREIRAEEQERREQT